jgi:hypothetical protein
MALSSGVAAMRSAVATAMVLKRRAGTVGNRLHEDPTRRPRYDHRCKNSIASSPMRWCETGINAKILRPIEPSKSEYVRHHLGVRHRCRGAFKSLIAAGASHRRVTHISGYRTPGVARNRRLSVQARAADGGTKFPPAWSNA